MILMKTNGTLITRKLWLYAPVLLLIVNTLQAQSGADFNFINHSLVSGTDRQSGAVYLFTNVRAGVDCRVTIVTITPGTSIPTFDDNSPSTGFVEAFQPRIQVNGRTRGYGEFHFRFVKAGTSTDTVMNEIPATSIDIDGNGSGPDSLLEFDEYFLPAAYLVDYDMLAGQLTFNMSLGSILGRHKAAIEYTSIDTTGRSVMFTVVYPHASTFSVRIGVDNNRPGNTNRQRSVYFKRFVYPNSFLPVKDLRSFAGASQNNAVKLNWAMNRGHNIVAADVERSINGTNFARVSTVSMASELNSSYVENNVNGNVYYRLKMTDVSGKISYSEVLLIKNNNVQNGFKVYPSVINDYTTVNFSAAGAGAASLVIADINGRIVKRQAVSVQPGFNSTLVNGLGQVPAGQYVAVLNGAGYSYTQKILIAK
jgi:hypothetical protein